MTCHWVKIPYQVDDTWLGILQYVWFHSKIHDQVDHMSLKFYNLYDITRFQRFRGVGRSDQPRVLSSCRFLSTRNPKHQSLLVKSSYKSIHNTLHTIGHNYVDNTEQILCVSCSLEARTVLHVSLGFLKLNSNTGPVPANSMPCTPSTACKLSITQQLSSKNESIFVHPTKFCHFLHSGFCFLGKTKVTGRE